MFFRDVTLPGALVGYNIAIVWDEQGFVTTNNGSVRTNNRVVSPDQSIVRLPQGIVWLRERMGRRKVRQVMATPMGVGDC